ncbi:hypothetical protein GQ600_774 [Phytophthora cactorum]|nr:hypothetical protein GQ600_774 [Phytophthora cactorum]
MSGRDFQATATQLLHRQSSSQHLRQFTFAATIANRFYSDNSLDRQTECRMCEEETSSGSRPSTTAEQLENELAEAERVRILKRNVRLLACSGSFSMLRLPTSSTFGDAIASSREKLCTGGLELNAY